MFNDIGYIINATMTAQDASDAINRLSDQERYTLLKHHFFSEVSYSMAEIGDVAETLINCIPG